jgi:hypothetical protein
MSEVPSSVVGLSPHRGVLVLVLGILSILVCGPVGPFAWVMGAGDLKRIRAGQMDPEGKGMTTAGMICGIVGTVLLVLALLSVLLVVVLGVGIAAAGAAGAGGP